VAAGGQADDNPTVFGAILRGELPAVCLAETDRLLAFLDRYPKAPFHALVIPKRFLPSVFDLTQADLPMLYDMKAMAEQVLEERGYPLSDSRLVFHVPPFNSVQHLHLHVLAPASEMGWHAALLEYPPSETRRCTRYASVVSRLERGRPAVPYARPAPPLLLRFFGTDLLPKVKNRRQGED
jgi:diadenosine tetraphosphate (Ap4A) HIT family hydrolase